MATAKKPVAPKDINTNKEAREKYYDDLTAYNKALGVKDVKGETHKEFNAAKKNAQYEAEAAKVPAADRARIDRIYQKELGRKPDVRAYSLYSKFSEEDMVKDVRRSMEYQQRIGNVVMLSGRDKDRGIMGSYVIRDNAGGRALLEDKEWLKERIKAGDEVIKPAGYGDVSSGGDFDQYKEGKEKIQVTSEMLSATPALKLAGYKVGDYVDSFVKVKKPRGGVFNAIDDALGTNTAQFIDKHVSDQVKFIMDPLGINSGFYTRNMASDAVEGGAKIFSTSEENVRRGQAYANVVVDIGLMIATGGAAAPAIAAKNAIAAANRYQAREISSNRLFADIGREVALAYVGASAAKAGQAAAAAANAAKAGQAAATAAGTTSRLAQAGQAVSTAVRAGVSTGGGLAAARFGINYAANKALGMDDSAAAREAGWSTLGAQTGQISTVARVATSKTAQKSLKDAEGNLNPIAIASLASSVSSGLSGLSRSGGGSIMRGLQQNLSWSQFNPVAGVSAIAGGANRMYSTLAGTSAVNFQSGPPDAYVAAGQEYYGSDITNTPIQGPGIAPTITVSPVSQGYTSQRYGGVDRLTAMSGNETLGSVDARQNWLPTLGGAANLGRDIFNVAVFGSMQPTIGENKRPIGFRRTTPRDTLLRQTRY